MYSPSVESRDLRILGGGGGGGPFLRARSMGLSGASEAAMSVLQPYVVLAPYDVIQAAQPTHYEVAPRAGAQLQWQVNEIDGHGAVI